MVVSELEKAKGFLVGLAKWEEADHVYRQELYGLGTRPSENQEEILGDRLGWKCTERNVWNL